MRALLLFLLVLLGLRSVQGGQCVPVAKTASPNGICIAQVADSDDNEYQFWNTKTNKLAGSVLPQNMQGLRNPGFIVDWSPSGKKLALLFFYGTKLSTIFLYSQLPDGQFMRLPFTCPNAAEMYLRIKGRKWDLSDSSGASFNGLGPWDGDSAIRLFAGDQKDVGDDPGTYSSSLIVVFRARFAKSKIQIANEKLVGPMNASAHDAFVKKWGTKYIDLTP